MKIKIRQNHAPVIALALVLAVSARAGTFKTIAIDGSFKDWAGVPLAYSQPQDATNYVAYQNFWACNDNDYLYLRFTIYPPAADPFTYLENIYVDTDNDATTGYLPYDHLTSSAFSGIGSELLIQAGVGGQEKNGGFNEGAIKGLDWQAAPSGAGTNFECRISRHATYASDGAPVFTRNTIAFCLQTEDKNFLTQEFAPTNGNGGLVYTFAPDNHPSLAVADASPSASITNSPVK